MRTTRRDQNRRIEFGALVSDAASGSGQASGVPYSFTRTANGTYVYQIDSRLVIESLIAIVSQSVAGYTALVTGYGTAGTFTVQTYSAAGALANAYHSWTCIALDGRL